METSEVNKTFEIEITDIAFGGKGVGRLDGYVYFVPGTIPGELILAVETGRKKNFGTALPLKVLRNSQFRIEPICPLAINPSEKLAKCPHFCPGCSYQHVSYEEEIKIKNSQFRRILEHNLKISADEIFETPVACPSPFDYRNKITLHPGENKTIGYFAEDNKTVIDVEQCHIANLAINGLLKEIRSKSNNMSSVTIRHTQHDGAICWSGYPKNGRILKEKTAIGDFIVPQCSFFQVNPFVTGSLIKKVQETVMKFKPEFVLDLYCGCGIFSIASGKVGAVEVFGIDNDPETIRVAAINAENHGIGKTCRFTTGNSEKFMKLLGRRIDVQKTLLIIDPPRSGLNEGMRKNIVSSGISKILYISCSPDTLARDLKYLCENGFTLISAGMADMFPRTSHFESVSVLGQ